jgi:hypothetical protein
MPSRSTQQAPIEKLLRRLSPRDELVRRLALLEVPGPHRSDTAFDRRINDLRVQLRPTPGEIARIIAEAGKIGQSMRRPGEFQQQT